jgi:hypothetical protein
MIKVVPILNKLSTRYEGVWESGCTDPLILYFYIS